MDDRRGVDGYVKNATASVGARVGLLTILALIVYLVVVTRVGERRLRAAGVDLDDATPAND